MTSHAYIWINKRVCMTNRAIIRYHMLSSPTFFFLIKYEMEQYEREKIFEKQV